jgi:hypothetical protein
MLKTSKKFQQKKQNWKKIGAANFVIATLGIMTLSITAKFAWLSVEIETNGVSFIVLSVAALSFLTLSEKMLSFFVLCAAILSTLC